MSRIRSKDTTPEKTVRSLLHRMGYRFRLHRRDLPGKPDIVLPKYRTAIFVHGCFWHRHPGCRCTTTPKSNVDFWQAKFRANVERDRKARRDLRAGGWQVVVVWECQTKHLDTLAERLEAQFKSHDAADEHMPVAAESAGVYRPKDAAHR